MEKAVRRDLHKMKAFVRFRTVDDGGEGPLHVAWFEPAHHIVEAVAPFFARRFAAMRWAILTPRRCVRWTPPHLASASSGAGLHFSPGARRDSAPPADAGEALWLTYYASITSEATHTIPPTAPYYAGRELNYAYYPQLVLAMVHRAADVPVLEMYFGYAWPTWLAAGAVMAFVLVRSLSTSAAALIAVALMLVGGDLSYLAAWWQHAQAPEWDYVLWPTNFLAPTMEVLHFNSWTPSLPITRIRGMRMRWLTRYCSVGAGLLSGRGIALPPADGFRSGALSEAAPH